MWENDFIRLVNLGAEAILVEQYNAFVFANVQLNKMLDLDIMPATITEFYQIVLPEHWGMLREQRELVKSGKYEQRVATYLINSSKEGARWFKVCINSFVWKNNPALAWYISDIHEQVVAESKLNLNLDFLNKLLELIPSPLFYKNKEGVFIGCNVAFCDLINTPKEKVIGKTISQVLPDNQTADFMIAIDNLLVPNGVQTHETSIRLRNNQKQNIVLHKSSFYQDKDSGGIIGIIVDLSEKRQAKKDLMLSEQRYKLLAESTQDVIWIMSFELETLYVSPSVERFLGHSPDEYLNLKPEQILAAESLKIARHYTTVSEQRLKSGQYSTNDYLIKEYEFIRKDGTTVWAEVKTSYYIDENKTVIGVHGIARDITERRKIMQNLSIAKDKAERAGLQKNVFIANMSHEIRSPLNAILGFTDVLIDESLSVDDHKRYLNYIKRSGKRLLNLINDIIDFSKIETGSLQLKMRETNLDAIMSEMELVYQENIKILGKKKLKIKYDNKGQKHNLHTLTDPLRLQQIFVNLITNAIKFTDVGSVNFGYKLSGKEIMCYVSDTGIGISKEQQQKIFNRYQQLDDNLGQNPKGSGLGLDISMKLSRMLGGNLTVESVIDKGSVFYFTLPYNPVSAPDLSNNTKIKTKQTVVDNWSQYCVLVAEDDEINYQLIRIALTKTGVNLVRAKNGQEAVDIIKSGNGINMVLMDIQMPQMNGYEATRQIKAHNKHMPVIAQTAFAMAGEEQKAFDAGCDDYLSKPIKLEALIQKMRKFL